MNFFKINKIKDNKSEKIKETQNNIKTHVKTEEKTSPVEKENQSLFFSVIFDALQKMEKEKLRP